MSNDNEYYENGLVCDADRGVDCYRATRDIGRIIPSHSVIDDEG